MSGLWIHSSDVSHRFFDPALPLVPPSIVRWNVHTRVWCFVKTFVQKAKLSFKVVLYCRRNNLDRYEKRWSGTWSEWGHLSASMLSSKELSSRNQQLQLQLGTYDSSADFPVSTLTVNDSRQSYLWTGQWEKYHNMNQKLYLHKCRRFSLKQISDVKYHHLRARLPGALRLSNAGLTPASLIHKTTLSCIREDIYMWETWVRWVRDSASWSHSRWSPAAHSNCTLQPTNIKMVTTH